MRDGTVSILELEFLCEIKEEGTVSWHIIFCILSNLTGILNDKES